MKIPFISEKIPYLNTEQMIDVDRAMVEDFKIELIQMMENAGRCLAWLARERFLKNGLNGAQIVVLAGTGGNGGGAMVCARRLHCWGEEVKVILTGQPGKNAQVPGHQLEILKRMGVDVMHSHILAAVNAPDLIIDGIIGYSLKGPPRMTAADMIRWANSRRAPILALDVPSGIDASTGRVFDPAIKASATMTLALPKEGLSQQGAEELVGELYLADISVPPSLYLNLWRNLKIGDIFAENDIVRIV